MACLVSWGSLVLSRDLSLKFLTYIPHINLPCGTATPTSFHILSVQVAETLGTSILDILIFSKIL